MRKLRTRITSAVATVDATDQRSQQVLELSTIEPDLLRSSLREALSHLSEEERQNTNNGLLSVLRLEGINIGHHLLVLGIPATTATELTPPEVATLVRYVRISEPRVMTALAPIIIDLLAKHPAPDRRVKPSRRAA